MRGASFYKFIFHPYTWICADLQRQNSCRNWHVQSKFRRLRKHCVSALTRLFVSKYSETQAVLWGVASCFTNKPVFPQNIWRVETPPFCECQPQWKSVKQTGHQYLKWTFWGNEAESFCFKREKIPYKEGHMCQCLRSPQNVGVLPI